MYYLYKITAPDNKYYIGISNNPTRRWRDHCSNKQSSSLISSTIQKYGKELMTFETLKEFNTKEEALAEEQRLVTTEFVLSEESLNQVVGGGMPPNSKATCKPIRINNKDYCSIEEAAKDLGYSTRNPLDRLIKLGLIDYTLLPKEKKIITKPTPKPKEKNITFENKKFSTYVEIYTEYSIKKHEFSRATKYLGRPPITLQEIESSKIFKTPIEINGVLYKSKAEAIRQGVITNYKMNVWLHKNIPIEHQKKVKVNMICLKTGKVLQTFDSLTEAAKSVGAPNPSHICMCTKGQRRQTYGYGWSLVE